MGAAGAILGVGGPALILAVIVARVGLSTPWLMPLAFVTFLAAAIVIAMDLRYGLALFIACAALSPKLPGVYGNLRVEDFLFLLVFGVWLARSVQGGRMPEFKSALTPVTLVLSAVGLISAVLSFGHGTMPDVKYAMLLQVKRFEYLLIFLVVISTVRSVQWVRVLSLLFVVSGALAAIYGFVHAEQDNFQAAQDVARVQGPEGENYNTLSGYLIVCISVGIGAALSYKGLWRTLIIASTAVAALGLLFSFSREGLVMLVGTLGVFLFTRQRWVSWAAILALIVGLSFSPPLRTHFVDTVTKIQQAPGGPIGSNSLTARIWGWDYRLRRHFYPQPLLGTGAGSVRLSVDNEYVLRICEGGIIGLGAFLAWLYVVGAFVRRAMRFRGFTGALAVGGLAAFSGLLIQGLAAASFTTIRTMEPFWFLLGLIGAAMAIDRQLEATASAEAPMTEPSPQPAVTA